MMARDGLKKPKIFWCPRCNKRRSGRAIFTTTLGPKCGKCKSLVVYLNELEAPKEGGRG